MPEKKNSQSLIYPPISEEERRAAIKKLNLVFKSNQFRDSTSTRAGGLELGVPESDKPTIFSIRRPGDESENYSDDPVGEAALKEFSLQYPESYRLAAGVHAGVKDFGQNYKNAVGLTFGNAFARDNPGTVSLRHSKAFPERTGRPEDNVMDTVRHEFSHIMGLPDDREEDFPSAYDVDKWSSMLHRDIQLPKSGQSSIFGDNKPRINSGIARKGDIRLPAEGDRDPKLPPRMITYRNHGDGKLLPEDSDTGEPVKEIDKILKNGSYFRPLKPIKK